ncbi:TPA: hypothetical protein SE358_000352 [Campylobacter jejuni]|nr:MULTISPECIES: hypothetical protein [Campylobacter]EDP6650207.1 hypothetical protein [Campylobacter jejuni]RTJ59189.1 hypothetical protein C3H67_02315 [Campylobacter jejuni]TEY00999.1 hypothetical protein ELQ11_02665 [Campylobacter sp. US50a]HEG3362605.1 hypothetical protein [Campylobacter jejuni]HEG6004600.1 hypothetical protein [Campylobacter jejuni]
MSGEEVKKAWNDRNYNLKLDKNSIVQGAGIVDTNNENIEFTPLIEIMQKEQKELIKYLQRKQKIDITI